jgi:hypothetical protein
MHVMFGMTRLQYGFEYEGRPFDPVHQVSTRAGPLTLCTRWVSSSSSPISIAVNRLNLGCAVPCRA